MATCDLRLGEIRGKVTQDQGSFMGQVYKLPTRAKSVRTLWTTSLREQLTVLVAHENPTLCYLIADSPVFHGHQVRVATEESTTHDLIAAEEIHLLLLDLHLLEGNGLANLLRKQKQRRDRPPYIIVMFDVMSETDRQRAATVGVDEYWPNLLKLPFLFRRIEGVMKHLSHRDERVEVQERREQTGGTVTTTSVQRGNGRRFLHYWFYRDTVNRALKIAGVVGPILTLINQYDVLLRLEFSLRFWMKVALTFLGPYCVSSFSSARAYMEQEAREQASDREGRKQDSIGRSRRQPAP